MAARSVLERWASMNRPLLDASGDGVCLVDLAGRMVLANTALEGLAAEASTLPEPAPPQPASALSDRPPDAAAHFAPLEVLASDPDSVTQDRFELAATQRAFERHVGPIRDLAGEVIGRVIVVREVSGDRQAEALQTEITGGARGRAGELRARRDGLARATHPADGRPRLRGAPAAP